jgi:hypothetical protein
MAFVIHRYRVAGPDSPGKIHPALHEVGTPLLYISVLYDKVTGYRFFRSENGAGVSQRIFRKTGYPYVEKYREQQKRDS